MYMYIWEFNKIKELEFQTVVIFIRTFVVSQMSSLLWRNRRLHSYSYYGVSEDCTVTGLASIQIGVELELNQNGWNWN